MHTSRCSGRARAATGPLVVTQRGRAVAVLQTIDAYERTQQECEVLRMLAAGEKELAAGQGHSRAMVKCCV